MANVGTVSSGERGSLELSCPSSVQSLGPTQTPQVSGDSIPDTTYEGGLLHLLRSLPISGLLSDE